MGERKVLNKYFGPDYDPEKIPRKKRAKNDQYVVRMMLPMSVRCKACGEYMYKGRKFNSRRENVEGEDYLGIRIIRFYMNCTNCRAEFCIKTDPQNEDYVVEAGAHRNYEPWRDREAEVEAAHAQRAEEDGSDAMKRLENRTKDSKLEMDILDTLDELRTMNARNNSANLDALIAKKRADEAAEREKARQAAEAAEQSGAAPLDDEDEEAVRKAFARAKRARAPSDDDDDDDVLGSLRLPGAPRLEPPEPPRRDGGGGGSSAALGGAPNAKPLPRAGATLKPAFAVQPKPKAAPGAASAGLVAAAVPAAGAATDARAAPQSEGGAAVADGAGTSKPVAAAPGLAALGAYGDTDDSNEDDASG